MIKLILIGALLYAAYRIYLPSGLKSGEKDSLEKNDDDYTDYEEVD